MRIVPLPLFASACFLLALSCLSSASAQDTKLGIFDGQGDVGTVLHPGSASFDPGSGVYTVTGSGDDMWAAQDDFHFVWKKTRGDVALSADMSLVGKSGHFHRKAVLMIRQDLQASAVAIDLAQHGDGMAALQFRDRQGENTREIESDLSAPTRVRLERRGNYVYAFMSDRSGKLRPSGASPRLALDGDIYVGLGVCSHDKNVTETAKFANVKLESLPDSGGEPVLYSTLETVTLATLDRRIAYTSSKHFETPNWSGDGNSILFDQEGNIRHLTLGETQPTTVDLGPGRKLLGDHGISPAGKLLAISDSYGDGTPRIYVVPVTGGTPRLVTKVGPSYSHGWSPDGKTLAFTGQRDGIFNIYTIPVEGGPETQLTTAKGVNDASEYLPDGHTLFFISDRTGRMQIWTMQADGSHQEQALKDESTDWFPHVSPDGKWIVFLAYAKDVQDHPANLDVELRLMSISDRKVTVLAKLLGGRGTINAPSWSPDSKRLAFVSYAFIPKADAPPEP